MHGALASHLQQLLAYHQWAYERILEAVTPLDEEAYRAPRGLFFGSLHGTLNHLAVVDRIWFARVQREPWQFERLDAEAAPDRASLGDFLMDGVGAWRLWLSKQSDATLGTQLDYRNMAGQEHRQSLANIVQHLVNHGTHHRGQMSAALTALGQKAPLLDYIYFLPNRLDT
ncbi:DinB family protein [Pseudomonas denitrificans (nom. rej.)]|nr:DinB family protein [Pseudomonas denitrificans (nom. rej.)]